MAYFSDVYVKQDACYFFYNVLLDLNSKELYGAKVVSSIPAMCDTLGGRPACVLLSCQ